MPLEQGMKDATATETQQARDAINTWPADVPEKPALLTQADALLKGVNAAKVPAPLGVRYPDEDLELNEREQLFGSRKGPSGAVGAWQDQDLFDTALKPGFWSNAANAPVGLEFRGGDWFDRKGTKQGMDDPYGTITVADLGSAVAAWVESTDVSELVNEWIGGTLPNWGFAILKAAGGSNSAIFDTWYAAAAENKPQLVVTIGGAEQTLTPDAMVSLKNDQLTTLAENPSFQIANYWLTYLYFDVTKLSQVTAARLRFHSTNQFGAVTGLVMRARNHSYDVEPQPIQYGVAARYPNDEGLETDPSLYGYINCGEDFEKKWMGSSVPPKYGVGINGNQLERITDPAQMLAGRFPALRVTLYKNGTISAPLIRYSALWRGFNALRMDSTPPRHIFWRYYLRFNSGQFGGTDVKWAPWPLGGKLPGPDGRFTMISGGFVQPAWPVLLPELEGAGLGNSGSTDSGTNGGSMRGNFDEADPNRPAPDVMGLANGDCYCATQSGQYGRNYRSSIPPGGRARLGRWVCVDGEAWMNTVTVPSAKPQRVLSIVNQDNGRALVTLNAPCTEPNYVTGQLWTIGGCNLVTVPTDAGPTQNGYFNQVGVPIAVVSPQQFLYPIPAKTAPTALPATSAQGKKVYIIAVGSQGNRDGGRRHWINGRLVGEDPICWWHSPLLPDGKTPIGWDNFLWTVYYGGAARPTVDSSLDLAQMAVGKEYIGPLVLKAV